jgi:hypothetical protein
VGGEIFLQCAGVGIIFIFGWKEATLAAALSRDPAQGIIEFAVGQLTSVGCDL